MKEQKRKIGTATIFFLLTCGFAFLLLTFALSNDWQTFLGNNSRSGATSETAAPLTNVPLNFAWIAVVDSRPTMSSPIVVGNQVFIGSESGTLYAFSADTGSAAGLPSFVTSGAVRCTPTYYQGKLYFGSRDGNLYCIDSITFALVWKVFHGGSQISSPLVVDNKVIIGVGDPSNMVACYDASSGNTLWQYNTGQIVNSSPAIYNGVVIVGNNSGMWFGLSETTGALIWQYQTGDGVFISSPAVTSDGNVVFAPGNYDRRIYMINAMTGVPVSPWPKMPSPTGLQKPTPSTTLKKATFDKPQVAAPSGQTMQDQPEAGYQSPERMVDERTLDLLLNMLDKTERDNYLANLGKVNSVDYTPLMNWLDQQLGQQSTQPQSSSVGGLQKPSVSGAVSGNRYGPLFNSSSAIKTSSPSVANGNIYITQRQVGSGLGQDEWTTYCATQAAVQTWSYTTLDASIPNPGYAPNMVISNNKYVYVAAGTLIYCLDANTGAYLGNVDVSAAGGKQIWSSLALANGRLYFATENGLLMCYNTANLPPTPPTTFNPTGGQNITQTQPTITWSGATDPQNSPLTYQILIGLGYQNRNLDQLTPTAVSGASYQPATSIASDTHVYYQVRAVNQNGAFSDWSPQQDFWVNRDTTPPLPPSNLTATPLSDAVMLVWLASPSTNLLAYNVYYVAHGLSFTDPSAKMTQVGINTLAYTVPNLVNGVAYDFMVTAMDYGEIEAGSNIVTATPIPSITINGLLPGAGWDNTIQGAVNMAKSGDTVALGVGIFHTLSSGILLPQGINMKGAGASFKPGVGTLVMGDGSQVAIKVVANPSAPSAVTTISQFTLTNAVVGIAAQMYATAVDHVLMYGLSGDGIQASAGGQLTVTNNTIMNCLGNGINDSAEVLTIDSCVIGKNSGWGVALPQSFGGGSLFKAEPNANKKLAKPVQLTINYNDAFSNLLGDIPNWVVGAGNISAKPLFMSEVTSDYREASGSPTIDAGDPALDYSLEPSPNGGRINQGVYGDTQYAATSPLSSGGGGGGGGGGYGGGGGGGSGGGSSGGGSSGGGGGGGTSGGGISGGGGGGGGAIGGEGGGGGGGGGSGCGSLGLDSLLLLGIIVLAKKLCRN